MRTTQTLFFVGVALLAVVGLSLSQDKSSQSPPAKLTTAHQAQPATRAGKANAADSCPVVGYLEKRDRTITIKAGPKGPLYSVKTADGKVLCENLSKEQLTAQAPEIAEFLNNSVAGAAGAREVDARLRPLTDASLQRDARR
jgi:hypothetical protein